jgi:TPR repeat protein
MLKKVMKTFFVLGLLSLQMVITNHQVSAMLGIDKEAQGRDNRLLAIRKEEKCTCGLVPEGLHWGCLYNQGYRYYKSKTAYKEAFECFSKAAREYNQPKAMLYVGAYYEFGLGVVDKSLDEAAEWYTKALMGGEACEEALPNLRRVIQKKKEALG